MQKNSRFRLKKKRTAPSSPSHENDTTATEDERLRDADKSVLASIPIVGPFLAWVKERFGWRGILLISTGVLVAVGLARLGKLPKSLISDTYQIQTPPPETRAYELIPDPDTIMRQAVKDAQFNIEASGVALTFIDPQVIKTKILSGFSASIVLLHPCSDAIARRVEAGLGNPGAKNNVLNQLRRFKASWQQLPSDKRSQLQVRLSKRDATMVVSMFDRRRVLYMYPCPFGQLCTASHVLVFKDYGEKTPGNNGGAVFEKHYDAVFRDAGDPLDFTTYDPDKPCPAPNRRSSAARK